MVVTVPYLSVFGNLNGDSNGSGEGDGTGHRNGDGYGRSGSPGDGNGLGGGLLPGTFPDGSPVPAEVARTLAGYSRTLVRVLTDPATGTPIDARAKKYAIPPDVRAALIQQWRYCTAPGCTRQAAKSEMDHIQEYNHENPDAGGLTVLENLHPLCKRHHQAKTDRRLRVFKTPDGGVRWVLPYGNEVTVFPPGDPVEVMHAEQFRRLTDGGDDSDGDSGGGGGSDGDSGGGGGSDCGGGAPGNGGAGRGPAGLSAPRGPSTPEGPSAPGGARVRDVLGPVGTVAAVERTSIADLGSDAGRGVDRGSSSAAAAVWHTGGLDDPPPF
ncbi:HNH endonuclease signature motif containing protein [Brevibacterium samyangense]|uniref:HNH endonuclease signature motif containing protein n=1 Tax=Brevibacterium samyangense TaxID=366888 RepID=UPI0031CFD557